MRTEKIFSQQRKMIVHVGGPTDMTKTWSMTWEYWYETYTRNVRVFLTTQWISRQHSKCDLRLKINLAKQLGLEASAHNVRNGRDAWANSSFLLIVDILERSRRPTTRGRNIFNSPPIPRTEWVRFLQTIVARRYLLKDGLSSNEAIDQLGGQSAHPFKLGPDAIERFGK